MNILVLCTGNSCRSQMAHGFFEHLGDVYIPDLNVHSAGIEAHGVNPLAIEVMAEVGMDISHHVSQSVEDVPNIPYDFVITVCDNANEQCPVFPGATKKLHQNFPDPANAVGTDQEILDQYRAVRDQIGEFCRSFLLELTT